MPTLLTIKDSTQETALLRTRVLFSLGFALVLAAALVGRMVHLQVFEFEHFRTLSEDNRVTIVPVAPTRGLIYDRNGIILAQNTPTFSLEVVPEAVEDMGALIESLRALVDISESDEQRFHRMRRKKRRFESVPLRLRLNPEEVARISVNRHLYPGVDVRARLSRSYPLGPLGAHLVGYVGRINERELKEIDTSDYRGTSHIGKTGVEQSYEDVLHGSVGYEHAETNAVGRTLRILDRRDPVPGLNLHLTIDASLQAVAEQALGDSAGSIVAIDPNNGAVLAFVSMPRFDPNLFVDGIDRKNYQRLLQAVDRPLFNRALNGQYPPGSTVKPFMGLAGLEIGTELAERHTFCGGWYQLPGKAHRYRDWKRGGHGRTDISKAIVESCDVYFYALAMELGIDRMHEFLLRFGLGERTGIDLSGESSGLMPSREWKRRARNQPWYPGETLIAGIGQGFMLATPLQLASATATLSMQGLRMRPQVVLRQVDPMSGKPVELTPELVDSVDMKDPGYWDSIVDAMVGVVHGRRGTARKVGADAAYEFAGKTGTAQVFGIAQDARYDESKIEKKLRDHGLFVAFAPADAPRIAIAVLVENGGSGSRSAAPVARAVLDYYLDGETPDDALHARASGPGVPVAVQ